jgi:hypothetical protein
VSALSPANGATVPDARVANAQAPAELVAEHRHRDLRRACPRGGGRRTGSAAVHDGGDPGEKRLLIDVADRDAVRPVVDQLKVSPALRQDHAPACGPRRVGQCAAGAIDGGHASETHIDGRFAVIEERLQLRRQRAGVRQDPRAGLHDVIRTSTVPAPAPRRRLATDGR